MKLCHPAYFFSIASCLTQPELSVKLKMKYLGHRIHHPTDDGHPIKPFFIKIQKFGLGQTNWADKFWGIFSRTISTHFDKVSLSSMFSIIKPIFLQKTLYPHLKYLFGIKIGI